MHQVIKTIMITGATGMVGQNLLEHPALQPYTILAPTRASLNLADYGSCLAYLNQYKPDLVIHAAGKVGGIQANIADPVGFLVENLDAGRNIVLAAHHAGIAHLINLGSSCMYPRAGQSPLTEDQILQGELEPTNEGYALAKIITARLCNYISKQYPSRCYKTLIPCNLYGRHDKFSPTHSHLIPAIIHKVHQAKLRSEKTVEIWGDGSARREFMYAGDMADAIIFCLDKISALPSMVNVGLGHDFSIKEYYQAVSDIIGWEGNFVFDLSKPVGMQRKLVSTTIINDLGWHARTSLSAGIELSYAFYKENYANI
ncbi:GDP-L-fucose synthase family protein [Parvibium lacunae]|uniref:GDP-L-fucose synthase n=1 Tax=Parvibium lacunae TaxID=1888893 RepID=A0A368L2S0_9BURK|nr:GDP-L-fucose synthase [Parvibium lacunae]RCS57408.1 GDP-L-fucose synthase [Parvibium lacunae]